MDGRLFTFIGGATGRWRVVRTGAVVGEPLLAAPRAHIIRSRLAAPPSGTRWLLRGVTSHERYVTGGERKRLAAKQPGLGRPEAVHAALIPIRKSAEWWELPQNERRRIFETRSRHIATGLRYLPAIARRLHHCRDLGEPFDFLTWFEYAPEHSAAFEDLVARLRASEEWTWVVREVDIRLVVDPAP